jgi:enediyne biosynthesis protein E5
MIPPSPGTLDRSLTPPAERPASPVPPAGSPLDLPLKLLATLALAVAYFGYRDTVVGWLQQAYQAITGAASKPTTMGIWVVVAELAALIWIWRRTLAKDKRFHAPLLVTAVLVVSDAGFGILENHFSPVLAKLTGGWLTQYSPTFAAIFATMLTEVLVGRFWYGKWPHLASAYVSGISAGILIKSPVLWPFVLCGMVSITSKYVLRVGDRHLWNPTNFGVTMMLFLAPQHVASLTVQAGNEVWSVLVIWVLGGMILYNLGRLHQPVAFVAAFVPLSLFRAWWTGDPVLAELAPITSPMFQLYMFFMITDPKTTTKSKWSQTLVVVLVAVTETFYRLVFRDVHSLYHALFTVGPISNLVEIWYFARLAKTKAPAPGGAGA